MTHDLGGTRVSIDEPEGVLRRAAHLARERNVEILVADARAVFGRDHLESAALHAERAKEHGTMSTRSLAMETLLYLSGHRQVSDAIVVAGIRRGTEALAIVVFGNLRAAEAIAAMGWTPEANVLDALPKDPSVLGLTEAERSTVPKARWPDLALERVALLDVEK